MDNREMMAELDQIGKFLFYNEIDPCFGAGRRAQDPNQGRRKNDVPDGT
jgi:hypothetical protein